MEIEHDNLDEILSKLKKPFDPPTMRHSGMKRRVISMIGGKRRQFAPTVRGEDIMASTTYDSLSIDMGKSSPGPAELAKAEEQQQIQVEFLKNKDKIALPKNDDGRFKI